MYSTARSTSYVIDGAAEGAGLAVQTGGPGGASR